MYAGFVCLPTAGHFQAETYDHGAQDAHFVQGRLLDALVADVMGIELFGAVALHALEAEWPGSLGVDVVGIDIFGAYVGYFHGS